MYIPVKLFKSLPQAVTPDAKYSGDAYDIYAAYFSEEDKGYFDSVCIEPGDIVVAHTGLIVELPSDCRLDIKPRSGLAKQGIILVNTPGRVDPQYRGDIRIIIGNIGKKSIHLYKGDAIAQMDIVSVYNILWQEVAKRGEIADSERGCDGFGSTSPTRPIPPSE
jgi:dUTP pyrophosphatase